MRYSMSHSIVVAVVSVPVKRVISFFENNLSDKKNLQKIDQSVDSKGMFSH